MDCVYLTAKIRPILSLQIHFFMPILERTVTSMKNELNYLLYLLEDDDIEVYQNVSAKLISLGVDILPELEEAYDNSILSANELLEERLVEVIDQINYDSVTICFKNWLKNDKDDLLKAMILIAKYQYRDLNEERILENIEEIVSSINFEISRYNPPLQLVSIINRFLYDTYEFRAVANKENASKHFAINHILSWKKGVPSSIAIIYLIIATKLDIPISGIVLADNLILGYFKRQKNWKAPKSKPKVHFYINPQDKGAIFTSNTLKEYLEESKIPFEPSFDRPACNLQIVKLILTHLAQTYHNAGQEGRVRHMNAWVSELEEAILW